MRSSRRVRLVLALAVVPCVLGLVGATPAGAAPTAAEAQCMVTPTLTVSRQAGAIRVDYRATATCSLFVALSSYVTPIRNPLVPLLFPDAKYSSFVPCTTNSTCTDQWSYSSPLLGILTLGRPLCFQADALLLALGTIAGRQVAACG